MHFAQFSGVEELVFWKGTILTAQKKSVKMVSPRAVSAPKPRAVELGIIKGRNKLKKKSIYRKDLPHKLYVFFASFSDSGAPSFLKFARSIGVTAEDVEEFREHEEFDRAYRECERIRRDYLIDNALLKRFDASFTKFLLSEENGDAGNEKIDFTLTVTGENGN